MLLCNVEVKLDQLASTASVARILKLMLFLQHLGVSKMLMSTLQAQAAAAEASPTANGVKVLVKRLDGIDGKSLQVKPSKIDPDGLGPTIASMLNGTDCPSNAVACSRPGHPSHQVPSEAEACVLWQLGTAA